jgi:hypothetical protein
VDLCLDRVRKLGDYCTGLQEFLVINVVVVGTSSISGSLLLEYLLDLPVHPAMKVHVQTQEVFACELSCDRLPKFLRLEVMSASPPILILDGDEYVCGGFGNLLCFAIVIDMRSCKLPKPLWLMWAEINRMWFKQTQLIVGLLLEASPWVNPLYRTISVENCGREFTQNAP